MVLDHKIQHVMDAHQIKAIEDWANLTPADVTSLHGVGPATLEHVRILLAQRGLCLKGDRLLNHHDIHQREAMIGSRLAPKDGRRVLGWELLIDTREQEPWSFRNIRADAGDKADLLIVPTRRATLKTGDYSIAGLEDHIAVERKSVADLFGTFGRGRDRFERELERMTDLVYAAVVCEGQWSDIEAGLTQSKLNPKTIVRSVAAWSQRYGVHFHMMPGRRAAELLTFRLLDRYWQDRQKERVQGRVEHLSGAVE